MFTARNSDQGLGFSIQNCDLPSNYRLSEKFSSTKNLCYTLASNQEGKSLFMKISPDIASAKVEYDVLCYLADVLIQAKNTLYDAFLVPKVYSYQLVGSLGQLVCEYIPGLTGRDLVSKINAETYNIAYQMIQATAQIHSAVSLSKLFSEDSIKRAFGSWCDCRTRLHQLLQSEGGKMLLPKEILDIEELLEPYFDILFEKARDFPCDYYKDANPANWLFPNSKRKVYAVDFENRRFLPFFVDVLNITEYGRPYLSSQEKSELFKCYLNARISLDPTWGKTLRNYELQSLMCLFGIYRHQEQMLHRLRDLNSNGADKDWNIRGFVFHLDYMRSSLNSISHKLGRCRKGLFVRQLQTVIGIYQKIEMRMGKPGRHDRITQKC